MSKQQGRIHGPRCVRLCYLVNSGRAFVRGHVCVRACAFVRARVYARAYVCARMCMRACVCVCFAILCHCGSANSLISALRLCVCMRMCMCVCMCVCVSVRMYMRVSPLHFVSIVQVGNKRFREFEKNGLRTDRRTDGPTDGRTDGRTDPLIEMRGRI